MAFRQPVALAALAAAFALTSCTESTGAAGGTSPDARADRQESSADNEELAVMLAADQAARIDGMTSVGILGAMQDAERRARTRAMLDANEITTAHDYFHAAFIFQHGGEPEDFLLAHVLAVTAVDKGHAQAFWIAAATLDRYLQSVGRPQTYGTQLQLRPAAGEVTQGDYDQQLIPDALRIAAGVPVLEAQENQRREMQAQMTQSSTGG